MRSFVRYSALVSGLFLATLAQAVEVLTLDAVSSRFSHAETYENSASVLYDGWRISFLSHDGRKIGAALVMGTDTSHSEGLPQLLSRIASVTGMGTPESIEFEGEQASALLVDQEVMGELTRDMDNVFSGSSLAAMAYLLDKEYFVINGICKDGSLHWKTAKKSGVELRMPMGEERLTAIEVNGRQQMNEFAAGVLADKLGLGKNNVPESTRETLRRQLSCKEVSYMNAKSNMLLARTSHRSIIGKRRTVAQMLKKRHYGAITYPETPTHWPEEEKPVVAEEPQQEPEKPAAEPGPAVAPLTPEAAREAYIKAVRAL